MPRDRSGRTYRVRQIPSRSSSDSLAGLLANLCEELGPKENIIICSLASSLVPFETPRTKTATINFKSIPAVFDNDDTQWELQTKDNQRNIIVDVHFLGFTALNDVDSDLHVLDCISISGLASHPFGSWAERKPQSNFMWLRDRLPHDVKQARSIIYGYDSRLVRSKSFQGIEDIAITFIAQLRSIGRSLKAAKPAVILAHSLGGIILKYAFLQMANSGDVENYMLGSIKEVIFFGVPNKGMEIEQWLPMVEGQPNEGLVHILSPNSLYLNDLDERFNGISAVRNLRLVSFYETEQSQTAEVLVDKKSAKQKGSRNSDILPIDKSHSDMVKFREGSAEYQIVAGYIHKLVQSLNNHSLGPYRTENGDEALSEQLEQLSLSPTKTYIDLAHCIVDSLELKDTTYRLRIIEEAYGPTFEWIWSDSDVGLVSWLVNGTGTYWISGKPGSGKSTLMKYIFTNYQDRVMQNAGSSERSHIPVGFFFYDRGSHLQKSFEGVLYSILHQILNSQTELVKEVSHIYLRRPQRCRGQWPLEDLDEALGCILKQTRLQVNIFLFLDALDEYNGRSEFIVDFIKRVVGVSRNSATRVKICFSSRLWNIFVDQFQESPGFKIHEQTKDDILAYITGKFNESPSITQLSRQKSGHHDSEISALTAGLVERAEGVFLWLKLVMNDLLSSSREGATVAELLEILASFPKELEDLYTQIVKRIPKEFRKESYAMLEIVLRSEMPIHSYDFWLATACAPCDTLEGCIAKIPTKAFLAPYQMTDEFPVIGGGLDHGAHNSFEFRLNEVIGGSEQYQRRLKSRCGGLIEQVPYQDRHGGFKFNGATLQFMHQTVKDFVSKPGFRRLITNEDNNSKENGYSFLAKYGLAQLSLERKRFSIKGYSSLPEYAPNFPNWYSYLHYAIQAESSTGMSQKRLLDSASEAFGPARNQHDVYGLFNSALSFGVVNSLQIYVQECLSEKDSSALRKLLGHGSSKNLTLLHDIVRLVTDYGSFLPRQIDAHFLGQSRRVIRRYYEESFAHQTFDNLGKMFNMLLDAGANGSSIYKDMTPFQMLCQSFREGYTMESSFQLPAVVEIVVALLKNGQDPNEDVLGKLSYGKSHRVICKPLHLFASPLAQILLNFGADVNALDEHGLTPLDIAFGASGDIFVIGILFL